MSFTLDHDENHVCFSYAGMSDCLLGKASTKDDDDSHLKEEMIVTMCRGDVGDVEGRTFKSF